MSEFLLIEERGGVGMITLSRPKAMNALNLGMVRGLAAALRRWKTDPSIHAIAIRGSDKNGPFGNFCAGVTSAFSMKLHWQARQNWKTSSQKNMRSITRRTI